MQRPNVLFLFSDQHNAKCLSCYGHGVVKTPNIDSIASSGLRFTNAYTVNPICTPSRVSFLSGVYPSTHGYYGLYGREPNHLFSMFAHFRMHGYRTGALGKLHTPRYWIEPDCQYIYDEFIEFPKYLDGAGLYDLNDNRQFTGPKDGECSNLPVEHSCEVALAKQVIHFLKNQGEPNDRGNSDDPWFAWVSFSRPHEPYTPSIPFYGMYPESEIPLPPYSDSEKTETINSRSTTTRLRRIVSAYYGLISQVDYAIGMIVEELKRQGKYDNTIIVYASDHGDYAGEHGLYEKRGGISYRAISNIPLIVKSNRGNESAATTNALVESIDLFPTLCDLVGLPIPTTVQGHSFVDVLENPGRTFRDSALTENVWRKSLATTSWRYVANLPGEQDELYSLDEDPWELVNRIADPDCQTVRWEMQRKLLDRVIRARKPQTVHRGGWHSHSYDVDGFADLSESGLPNPYW